MRSIIFAVNTKVVEKKIMNKPLLLKGNKKYIYVQKVFKKADMEKEDFVAPCLLRNLL
ncbi:hypothetical protein SDC9_172336 [bioreactor metagenome]|uniref:Uncharacterized protein n=2 Tax=root TaxID=1 RepID=A0A0X8VAV8_ANAPI|nr:hypothetical protein CPRO_20440 [Anaerotignum propionicum DSM 1682]SHE87673.1 hypothetical protein SAMN02745151_02065 [[Clostridium] propionicum DSM 1682] [Anaerotignum propionicum DSM 1682]